MTLKAFAPGADADTAKLSATTTSAAVAINVFGNATRVVNLGPNDARIKFGKASPGTTATSTSMLVLAGTVEVFTKGASDQVAAICDTGTASLEFYVGEGQ